MANLCLQIPSTEASSGIAPFEDSNMGDESNSNLSNAGDESNTGDDGIQVGGAGVEVREEGVASGHGFRG